MASLLQQINCSEETLDRGIKDPINVVEWIISRFLGFDIMKEIFRL